MSNLQYAVTDYIIDKEAIIASTASLAALFVLVIIIISLLITALLAYTLCKYKRKKQAYQPDGSQVGLGLNSSTLDTSSCHATEVRVLAHVCMDIKA